MTANALAALGLSEKDVVDTYIYVLARYLVIRQERIDIAEESVDYNVIKFNELGKAEFVNPNQHDVGLVFLSRPLTIPSFPILAKAFWRAAQRLMRWAVSWASMQGLSKWRCAMVARHHHTDQTGQRAANRATLPPAAVVLMVSVCSAQKRSR